MAVAIVIAGGSGVRANNAVPKQFLTVYDVPIIVYTLRNLQEHNLIDDIVVVVPPGWERFVAVYAEQYEIKKIHSILAGGKTRHETISKAIDYLCTEYSGDTMVGIVDANRPLIPHEVLSNVLKAAKEADSSLAVEPCYDSMFYSKDCQTIERRVDREFLFKGQTPEFSYLYLLKEIYERANTDGIEDATASLFLHYGKVVKAVQGSARSFKITTADDVCIFKALIKAEKMTE